MSSTVKYVAELSHVREVSLFGTADLKFWKDQLKQAELVPVESDGKARILILAADSRFFAVRFQELSFCVLVRPPNDALWRDAAYLVHAFNSRRFFAWCERAFYSTPYSHGQTRVSAAASPSVQLILGDEVVFRAEMRTGASGAPTREPSRSAQEGWEGPVFLPENRGGKDRARKLFFARIKGRARAFPFERSTDVLQIRPSKESEVFQALIDSGVAGEEWVVREDAAHAKSKTYHRSDAPAGMGRGDAA